MELYGERSKPNRSNTAENADLRDDLGEVPGGTVFLDAFDAAGRRHAAGAIVGDGGAVNLEPDCREGGKDLGSECSGRQIAVASADENEGVSGVGDLNDRGRRVYGCSAADAEFRGRVFLRGCTDGANRRAVFDRADHPRSDGRDRCDDHDCDVPAHFFIGAGGHDGGR
jgi:hypothetical protein